MMNVHVRIEKFKRDHSYTFDNVIPRDEVVHKLLSDSREYKDLYDAKQLQDSDIFITWTDPNAPIEVPMTVEEAVVATEAAPEIAQPRINEDTAGITAPNSDDAVIGGKNVAVPPAGNPLTPETLETNTHTTGDETKTTP